MRDFLLVQNPFRCDVLYIKAGGADIRDDARFLHDKPLNCTPGLHLLMCQILLSLVSVGQQV